MAVPGHDASPQGHEEQLKPENLTKMKTGVAAIPHVLLYGIAAVILSFVASFMG